MSGSEFLGRVLLSLLLGAVIGIERQLHQRTAGLRTNALVAIGAALFVLMSGLVPGQSQESSRIAAQVVSGIGFLGAGVIMREGLSVHGLNTAATLWCAAAVGVLCGMGLTIEAAFGTTVVVVANILLRNIAIWVNRLPAVHIEVEHTYRLRLVCAEPDEVRLRSLLLTLVSAVPLELEAIESRSLASNHGRLEVFADLSARPVQQPELERIIARLSQEPGVTEAGWKIVAYETG